MTGADSGNAIFIPSIDKRPRMVMREVPPSIAVGAIVLAHGAPGPFTQVRTPAFPVFSAALRFLQPDFFLGHSVQRSSIIMHLQDKSNLSRGSQFQLNRINMLWMRKARIR